MWQCDRKKRTSPHLSVSDAHLKQFLLLQESNENVWRVQAQPAHPKKHLVLINCHAFAKSSSLSSFRAELKTNIVYFANLLG